MPAENARNHVLLTADVAGSPDAVFTYFTDNFFELWPGKAEVLQPGDDPNEPKGSGWCGGSSPPGSPPLEERIITHDRPTLIEYVVINDAPLSNHLGRIEFTRRPPRARRSGTRSTSTTSPPSSARWSARSSARTWALASRRKLRGAFPN